MFDKQVTALTTILKDKDIREYSGDAFWNIIKAVVLGDVGALLDATNDLKNILFHPKCFFDKLYAGGETDECFFVKRPLDKSLLRRCCSPTTVWSVDG